MSNGGVQLFPCIPGYTICSQISRSPHSTVYQCIHKGTKERFAAKQIRHEKTADPRIMDLLNNEVNTLQVVDKNLSICLTDIVTTSEGVFLIMPFMDGPTLLEFLTNQTKFSLLREDKLKLARQVVLAVYDLHESCRIAHRDIKLENILMDRNQAMRLSDFGFSTPVLNEPLTFHCGSINYVAPEILCKLPYNGLKSDVWSLGVVVFSIFALKLPFESDDRQKLIDMVKKGQFRADFHPCKLLCNLVSRMLTPNPDERFSINDVIAHPLWEFYNCKLTPTKRRIPEPTISVYTTLCSIESDNESFMSTLSNSLDCIEEDPHTLTSSPAVLLPLYTRLFLAVSYFSLFLPTLLQAVIVYITRVFSVFQLQGKAPPKAEVAPPGATETIKH